jgi:hypothetical protein
MKRTPKDPFHRNEPQVPAHQLPPKPPDLRPFDEAKGGINQIKDVLDGAADANTITMYGYSRDKGRK